MSERLPTLGILAFHGLPLAFLLAVTLVLFRSWLGSRLPGGTDSGFLYSELPLFQFHGLRLFTVWLPEPLGQVSQYSMYWLLAMLTTVFRSAVGTYKLVAVVIGLLSSFGMYAVSWSWSRSRIGALAAALAYSYSPLSVSEWMSGHLDVQLSIALGPLVVWLVVQVLDTGSKRAAVGLGLCGSALLLLTTGQAAYWLPAVAVVVLGKLIVSGRGVLAMLRKALTGALLATLVFVLASAVQLLPWLKGAHAAYAGGQNLAIATLAEHAKYSLPFAQGILGVPREAYLPPGANVGIAGFSSLLYIVPQVVFLIFALVAILFRRKNSLAIMLLVLAVAAWFIAAGPYGPARQQYEFIWQHVPYFQELRVPNRWLMISTFSVSVLIAQSIAVASSKISAALASRNIQLRGQKGLAQAVLLLAAGCSLVVVNAGGIIARGLPTITPPASYVRTYVSLARTPGDWRALTVPFGQAWMGAPAYGDYEGLAADLGVASTLYDGRSVLANGGWDPAASQFDTFLEELVNQGVDHNLAPLLGMAGVKYVVVNPEAPVQAPWNQAQFFASQPGFKRIMSSGGVTVFENTLAQSQVTHAQSSCVIAGGYPVLADLSEDPAFSLSRTAVYFADQVVASAGWSGLEQLVASSHCLLMGPGAAGELTVLRGSVESVEPALLAPSTWQSGAVEALVDSQAAPAEWVQIPPGGRLSWHTTVQVPGSYSVWLRIMRQPDAAPVRVTVNGVPAGTVSSAMNASVGYQWLHADLIHLDRGRVQVDLTGQNSRVYAQVAEMSLVRGNTPDQPPAFPSSSIVQDISGMDSSLYSSPQLQSHHPLSMGAWHATGSVRAVLGRHGSINLTPLALDRRHSDIASVSLPRSISPTEPLAFQFQGSGSGAIYTLSFVFQNGDQKSFSFRDTTSRARLLFFTPDQGGDPATLPSRLQGQTQYVYVSSGVAVPEWNQLDRVVLSTGSPFWPGGRISIAGPFPLKTPHSLPFFSGNLPGATGAAHTPSVKLATPVVSAHAAVSGLRPGILDFSQAYDPHWQLVGAPASLHTVELGFENSYLVSSGASEATLSYSVAPVGEAGTIVSLAIWFLGLLGVLCWRLIPGWRLIPRRRREVDAGPRAPVGEPARRETESGWLRARNDRIPKSRPSPANGHDTRRGRHRQLSADTADERPEQADPWDDDRSLRHGLD